MYQLLLLPVAWLHVTHLAEEVPTVSLLLWELGDEYQLLFCFWPALAAQLGRGPAAPTLYCGWSALLYRPLSGISVIRNLDQFFSFRSYHPLSGPPCHLAGHIFLCQAVPAISDLNGGAFAQTHNSHCQCQCS